MATDSTFHFQSRSKLPDSVVLVLPYPLLGYDMFIFDYHEPPMDEIYVILPTGCRALKT